jgi:hypothetical protein
MLLKNYNLFGVSTKQELILVGWRKKNFIGRKTRLLAIIRLFGKIANWD